MTALQNLQDVLSPLFNTRGAAVAVTIAAASLGGCASTRNFDVMRCEDTTVYRSLLTGQEVGRYKAEVPKECMAGMLTIAMANAAKANNDPVMRENMLNVAAAAFRADDGVRRYAAAQAEAAKLGVDLATRQTDIRFAAHPTDRSKVVMYRLRAL